MRAISVILLGLVFLVSCSDPEPVESLFGTWILTQRTGGFGGGIFRPDSGTVLMTVIDKDHFVRDYDNGILVHSRKFQFIKVTYSGRERDALQFYNDPASFTQIIDRADAGALILIDYADDGYTYYYSRK